MTTDTTDTARDQRAEVAQRVLDAATRLFAEQGYESTSVQQIVEAAGVTKGAMYHYFRSKDALLAESYARLLQVQSDHLTRIAQGPGTVRERLRLIAEDLVVTTLENLDSATVFYRSLHLLSAPFHAAVREQRRGYRQDFERVVQEGLDDGELRADLQVDLVSYSFFGAIGYLTVWFKPGGSRSIEDVARGYGDLLIAAVS